MNAPPPPRQRRRGAGTVDPTPDGRFRPRLPRSVGRGYLDVCNTYEEAAALLDAALVQIAAGDALAVQGLTLRAWGERWLDERETSGASEDVGSDRSRWRVHVEPAAFIDLPLAAISSAMIRDWVAGLTRKKAAAGHKHRNTKPRKLGTQTIRNVLNLLRCCLEAAVEAELIEANPARVVRLPRAATKERRTFDPWTYLLPDEEAALLGCQAIPEEDCDLMAFALWTGVREGEQWNLELVDVHAGGERPHVVVRFGKPGQKATKTGRIRRVPLYGLALEATLRQLVRLAAGRPNAHGLLWPSERGERRQDKKAPRGWPRWLEAAGLVAARRHDRRPVRWHDLRHSCASALVAGWRGRPWRLEEVKELLGHRSITTTQRYAHLAASVVDTAARETDRAADGLRMAYEAEAGRGGNHVTPRNHSAPPARIGRATFGLGNRCSIH